MDASSSIEATRRAGAPLPEEGLRCPHLVYRDILGADYVAGLLDHVAVHRGDFQNRLARNLETGEEIADPEQPNSANLYDVGAFLAPIKSLVSAIAAPALRALRLYEASVEPREFFITAYSDGGRVVEHVDTHKRLERVRILSCVYYFAVTPRRFSGGALRLYGFPEGPRVKGRPPSSFVDIEPDTDTLVIFPSWISHEVMPVHVPSGAWLDSRFTINCWMHRAG